VKFAGGFLPFLTKPFGEWFGKMLFYVIVSSTVLLVAGKIFPTKPTTVIEKIETQVVNQCPEVDKYAGLHFNIWKLKLGIGI
jgi:hypothetical protein